MKYLVGLANRASGIGPVTVPRVMLRIESRFAPRPDSVAGTGALTAPSAALRDPSADGLAPSGSRLSAQSRLATTSEERVAPLPVAAQPHSSAGLLVPHPHGDPASAVASARGASRPTASPLRPAARSDAAENDPETSSLAELPFPGSVRTQAGRERLAQAADSLTPPADDGAAQDRGGASRPDATLFPAGGGQVAHAAGGLSRDGEALAARSRWANHSAVDASSSPVPAPAATGDAQPALERLAAAEPKVTQRSAPEGGSAPVHVQIGRIEVRAVAPPLPSRPAPRPRPRPGISLSDYLAQHKRGIP